MAIKTIPNYDHSALKAIAKANPGLIWQFYSERFFGRSRTRKGVWQSLPKNKVPKWDPDTQYRVKLGQKWTNPATKAAYANPTPKKFNPFTDVAVRKESKEVATPKHTDYTESNNNSVFNRILNVLNVLRDNNALSAAGYNEAVELLRYDTSFNQRAKLLNGIRLAIR